MIFSTYSQKHFIRYSEWGTLWLDEEVPLHVATSLFYLLWSEVKVAQSCLTLCDPMDCTVHGILQARILEWVAFPLGSSQPRDQTQASRLQVDSLPAEPQRNPKNTGVGSLSLLQQIFPTQESNWRNRTALQVDSLPTELIREAQDYLLIQYHC